MLISGIQKEKEKTKKQKRPRTPRQLEAEAAHPAPARGRWKLKAPWLEVETLHPVVVVGVVVVGVLGAGGGSVAVLAGKMGTKRAKTEALVLSDCDSDGIPSFMVSCW